MNFLAIAFSGPVFWLASAVALTGILHMVVVKLDLFPAFKLPLDGGRSFRGKRIFGDNKTWRGVCFMIVGSAAVGFVQGAVGGAWAASAGLELIAYSAVGSAFRAPEGWTSFAVGYAIVNTIFGLGYALGELPNSFLKAPHRHHSRQAGRWSGRSWFFCSRSSRQRHRRPFSRCVSLWLFLDHCSRGHAHAHGAAPRDQRCTSPCFHTKKPVIDAHSPMELSMSDEVLTAVKCELATVCGVEREVIRDDGNLLGYGLDSVRSLDLILAMEGQFDIEISEHDPALAKVVTVRDLAALVDAKRDAR